MTDTPLKGAATAAPDRLPLIILAGGSFVLIAGIILLAVFVPTPEPVRLMLAGAVGTLLGVIVTISGFYYGSSIGSKEKDQTISGMAAKP